MIHLIRTHFFENRTVGRIRYGEYEAWTLEPPWLANQLSISCIPDGDYAMVYDWSPKFKRKMWRLLETNPRTGIRIHPATSAEQLEGCIALGFGIAGNLGSLRESKRAVDAFEVATTNPDGTAETRIIRITSGAYVA